MNTESDIPESKSSSLVSLTSSSITLTPEMSELLLKIGGEGLLAGIAAIPLPPPPRPPAWPASTPANLQAALAYCFILSDLAPASAEADNTILLSHAAAIQVGRDRRLRLSDEARAHVLRTATPAALSEQLASSRDADLRVIAGVGENQEELASAYLRQMLREGRPTIADAPAGHLRAAAKAREALSMVDFIELPSLAELERSAGLAELLNPLRVVIGATGYGADAPGDRFVGRDEELRTLRIFVNELRSESNLETVTRFVKTASNYFSSGRQPAQMVMLHGRGGLGKSALVAKFMLNHALTQTAKFPFAYLDFDRASLARANPMQLLAEVRRQVALQFPEKAMATVPNTEPEQYLELKSFISSILDRSSTGRTFLLVLDTMEIVQANPVAKQNVLAFLHDLGRNFAWMRIVVAGRTAVSELRKGRFQDWVATNLELQPLPHPDAVKMVNLLGQRLLGSDWNEAWAGRIAGAASMSDSRREPLALRLSVELLRGAPAEKRPELVEKIEKEGERADPQFVGWLYQQRVLSHISDPDAQKLAWPGLVVRMMSRQMARVVLAPLCGIDPKRIDHAFDSLSQQVWIVSPHGDATGHSSDIIRHNPELRARTLSLMRCHDHRLFHAVGTAAIKFLENSGLVDHVSDEAEIFYLRLLMGGEVDDLAHQWKPEYAPYMADAADDFEPGSRTQRYLAVWTAQKLLSNAEIRELPLSLACEHIVAKGRPLTGLGDEHADKRLLHIAPALCTYHSSSLSADERGIRDTLLIKTGQWKGFDPVPLHELSHPNDVAAQVYFLARDHDAIGRVSGGYLEELMDWFARYNRDRTVEREKAMAHALPMYWRCGTYLFDKIDAMLAASLHRSSSRGFGGLSGVTMALAFGRKCLRPALENWLASRTGKMRLKAVSVDQIKSMIRHIRTTSDYFRHSEFDMAYESLIKYSSSSDTHENNKYDDEVILDHIYIVFKIIHETIDDDNSMTVDFVNSFFRASKKDWLIPMTFAFIRIFPNEDMEWGMNEILNYKNSWIRRRLRKSESREVFSILRESDESGSLQILLESSLERLFTMKSVKGSSMEDLIQIRESLAGWAKAT